MSKESLKNALKYLKSRCLTIEQTQEIKDVLHRDEFLHVSEVEPVLTMLINDEFDSFLKEMEKIGAYSKD